MLLLSMLDCKLMGAAGRWPDSHEAFLKTKASMGVQLAEALQSSFGLDATATEQYVDVLAEGFAFRLFLWSDR